MKDSFVASASIRPEPSSAEGVDGGEAMPNRDGADGTERLCLALYGRKARARDYLGGSDARMLHDAADRLAVLPALAAVRAVSDNGKRWRLIPVDGDWEMQPVGHISAGEAELLCKKIEASLSATSASPGKTLADAPNNNPSPLPEAPAEGRVVWTCELEDAFRLAFEGYSKPADHFHDSHTWGCFILKRVSGVFSILQKMKRDAGWPLTTPPAPSPDALAKAVEPSLGAQLNTAALTIRNLREIVAMFHDRIMVNGEWDDGCFYYRRTSTPELQEPLRRARATSGESHD